jgi:hypothetical protein
MPSFVAFFLSPKVSYGTVFLEEKRLRNALLKRKGVWISGEERFFVMKKRIFRPPGEYI